MTLDSIILELVKALLPIAVLVLGVLRDEFAVEGFGSAQRTNR